MLTHAKATWNELKGEPAGRRFENHFRRHEGKKRSPLQIVALWAAIVASTAVGIVLAFIPGPAVVFFALSAGLVATQSLWAARLLDKGEMKTRAMLGASAKWWKQRSIVEKGVTVAAAVLAAGSMGAVALSLLVRVY